MCIIPTFIMSLPANCTSSFLCLPSVFLMFLTLARRPGSRIRFLRTTFIHLAIYSSIYLFQLGLGIFNFQDITYKPCDEAVQVVCPYTVSRICVCRKCDFESVFIRELFSGKLPKQPEGVDAKLLLARSIRN